MEQPDEEELIPTRTTLLTRLKDWQDQTGWQRFFDTYWKLIYHVARKSGLGDAEAQDAVQETMIAVARHMPGFKYDRSNGSFKTWLLNMTRWRITDQLRKRLTVASSHSLTATADTHTGVLEQVIDPDSPAMDALLDSEWERNLLEAATARVKSQIDPQKYQVFDLYVKKEFPPEKVARIFGITVDQVYLIKHRVTAMIKEEAERLQAGVS